MDANVLGGYYRGLELPALIFGFALTVAAVVMLVFTGPIGPGWVMLPFGSAFAIPASYRANKRAAAGGGT